MASGDMTDQEVDERLKAALGEGYDPTDPWPDHQNDSMRRAYRAGRRDAHPVEDTDGR